MIFTQEINRCFENNILDKAQYEQTLAKTAAGIMALRRGYTDNSLPLLRLPEQTADIAAITATATRLRENFKHILVLGTGGSSLGGQTLYALKNPQFGTKPHLHFLDNVDPTTFDALYASLDLKETACIVISKSGGTAETLMQLFTLFARFQQQNLPVKDHFVVITEPTNSPLKQFAQHHALPCFDHDPNVGGRFSVLSIVALLPAMIAGVDCSAVRAGANSVLQSLLHDAPETLDCAQAAAMAVSAAAQGKSQSIVMPYIDQLSCFGLWYRQLWAESIGKNGKGTTPIRALGTVDQHSQLQLYLDGPKDKLFTVITKNAVGTGDRISPTITNDPRLEYLQNKTMGDLLSAEQEAIILTLVKNNCPVRVLRVATMNEQTLGALLMHYMLKTILAAHLWGVNAFDQPAVEQGKIITKEFLAKI
jgi:glucose-6-phosphate isomerase